MTVNDYLENVQNYGKNGAGKKFLEKHLEGDTITLKGAILAKCYDCMGYNTDGLLDCKIPHCPLYPFMPYRKGEKRKFRARAIKDDSEE